MNIAITGIAGFLGSHIADKCIDEGHKVGGIDNLVTGLKSNVNQKAYFLQKSIFDVEAIRELFKEIVPEVVIHCAASYANPTKWISDVKTNVTGTINVVRCCQEFGVKSIIYLQTSLCYGYPRESPITLNHPINPQCSYAITKTAAEKYIELSKIPFVSFRLSNMYGPRNLSGPVPTFYKNIVDGKPCHIADTRRDFVYMADLITIVDKALNDPSIKGYFHISTGKDYSIQELFNEICLQMDAKPIGIVKNRQDGDVPTIMLDPSRTQQIFKYIPSTPLSFGVQMAVEWYAQHGVRATYTHLAGIGRD